MLFWRLARLSLQKRVLCNNNIPINVLRSISTSKKNREATATTANSSSSTSEVKSTWQSYGFGLNEKEDLAHMHLSFFFSVTMVVVMCSFYAAYAPNTVDWEQREAFLELRKREELGLPLIDPNYIDPSLIVLPAVEDLEDEDIII